MNNATLFSLCCLIWGSTWIAITYQIGHTSETFAIALRYLLASACLGAYCLLKRLPLALPVHVHIKMAAVGVFLYSLNYTLLYLAQAHIISALLALMSSCIIYINVVLRRWWLKEPIRKEVVVGATFGLGGIICLFVPEFSKVSMDAALATGLGIAFVSFLCASIGNVISERILTAGTPVIQMNFYAMSYAMILLFITSLLLPGTLVIPSSTSFYLSLVYLALFGSVFAFGAYMKLLKQMGADKAAYVVLVYPMVALLISTFFEGYQWTMLSVVGVVIVLMGNAIAMGKIPRFMRRPSIPN
ncbi:DMT family transporter [Alteromonas sp. 009811495]|mgnify:FL=1|jgi:drug/metabolite transporter (DMT)-like permease|uniref:DMT family transporter n=1 Tax=Alteromonas sp. 009811495 TaxID=3002962 RepID=UPI00237ED4CE|nr:EamA family transporter [Alteromonas sp. 009811495]MEC8230948.1 EamA family transporter [Pseudomonadota bacterium]WDT86106.1 EamA family transporter [Alteromonas sp. 009811495]